MCNYNGLIVSRTEFIRLKEIEKELTILNNIRRFQDGFDYQDWPIIKPVGKADFELVNAEWGFIPSHLRNREEVSKFRKGYIDPNGKFKKYTTLNARGDELFEKRWYAEAAEKRPCLVLSSHFYEWRHEPKLGKKGQPLKATEAFPYCISLKNQNPFLMAGIWQNWTDKDTGETIDTFAICTGDSDEFMSQIHNLKLRQPTILPEGPAYDWLFKEMSREERRALATFKLQPGQMKAHTVPKDFKQLEDPTQPYKYEGLSELITV